MSELIDNDAQRRKDLLKHLILQLHTGAAPAQVQKQLVRMLGQRALTGEQRLVSWSEERRDA
jgi:hypothetical protein